MKKKVSELLLGDVIGFNGKPVSVIRELKFETDNFSTVTFAEESLKNGIVGHQTMERDTEIDVYGRQSSKYMGNGRWERVK